MDKIGSVNHIVEPEDLMKEPDRISLRIAKTHK